jgi:hypothetical protein
MNPDLQDWQQKTMPRLHNNLVALIVEQCFPGTHALPAPVQATRYGWVRDVLDGFPVPVLSQRDRDAITAAAKPIIEGAGA